MLIMSVCLKELRPNLKLVKLKLMVESRLLSLRISLVKCTLKIGQEKYLLLIVLKINLWTEIIKL